MVTQVLNLIFGSKNDREIKALLPIVERINSLESGLTPLSDDKRAEVQSNVLNAKKLGM